MVIKVVELIGISKKSFDDAFAQGVKRATKTLRNVTGVDVVGQTAAVAGGKVAEYKVNLKVAFVVE
jgi:flavin-binding protein dodecin